MWKSLHGSEATYNNYVLEMGIPKYTILCLFNLSCMIEEMLHWCCMGKASHMIVFFACQYKVSVTAVQIMWPSIAWNASWTAGGSTRQYLAFTGRHGPVIVYVWQQLVNNLWFGYKYARSFHIITAVVYRYKEKHTHKQTKDHNWVSLDFVDLVLECSCSCMSTVVSVTAFSVLVEAYFCILYSEACGDSREACSEILDVLQLLTFLGDSGLVSVSFPVSKNWRSLSSTAPRTILHGSPNSLWRIADERKI